MLIDIQVDRSSCNVCSLRTSIGVNYSFEGHFGYFGNFLEFFGIFSYKLYAIFHSYVPIDYDDDRCKTRIM